MTCALAMHEVGKSVPKKEGERERERGCWREIASERERGNEEERENETMRGRR